MAANRRRRMSAAMPVARSATAVPLVAVVLVSLVLVATLLVGGCASEGPLPDPARSADLARSAAEASTTPRHEVTAEKDLRPRTPPAVLAGIGSAVANPARPATDRARDTLRKPAEVLAFFGIRPGMSVLDLFSGGGYYTEILSHLVGQEGHVVAHNNAAYLRLSEDELAERLRPGRLPNVTVMTAEPDSLDLPPAGFDAVVMVLAYHDLYRSGADGDAAVSAGVRQRLLAAVHDSLAAGGILGVVDHVAPPGMPVDEAASLHRIDPRRLQDDVTAAGFVLEGASDVLRNPADDGMASVFDARVRGRTDKVVLRFRKP